MGQVCSLGMTKVSVLTGRISSYAILMYFFVHPNMSWLVPLILAFQILLSTFLVLLFLPVNVETSTSLVICANNIGIGNVSFGSVIPNIPWKWFFIIIIHTHQYLFHLNQVLLYHYHFLYYPHHLLIHFVQLKNFHQKNLISFSYCLFYEVKPFAFKVISLV